MTAVPNQRRESIALLKVESWESIIHVHRKDNTAYRRSGQEGEQTERARCRCLVDCFILGGYVNRESTLRWRTRSANQPKYLLAGYKTISRDGIGRGAHDETTACEMLHSKLEKHALDPFGIDVKP